MSTGGQALVQRQVLPITPGAGRRKTDVFRAPAIYGNRCGAVADAIGVRLAKLARGVQVLAVTHAPQVAARADHHYLITKDALEKGRRVATRVTELAAERRREEVARMLAGAEITNEARAAAERLIKAAS